MVDLLVDGWREGLVRKCSISLASRDGFEEAVHESHDAVENFARVTDCFEARRDYRYCRYFCFIENSKHRGLRIEARESSR